MALNANARKHIARMQQISKRMDAHREKVEMDFLESGDCCSGRTFDKKDRLEMYTDSLTRNQLLGRNNVRNMKEAQRRIRSDERREIHRHHGGK